MTIGPSAGYPVHACILVDHDDNITESRYVRAARRKAQETNLGDLARHVDFCKRSCPRRPGNRFDR